LGFYPRKSLRPKKLQVLLTLHNEQKKAGTITSATLYLTSQERLTHTPPDPRKTQVSFGPLKEIDLDFSNRQNRGKFSLEK
jgi:hypothetical protein